MVNQMQWVVLLDSSNGRMGFMNSRPDEIGVNEDGVRFKSRKLKILEFNLFHRSNLEFNFVISPKHALRHSTLGLHVFHFFFLQSLVEEKLYVYTRIQILQRLRENLNH